LLLHSTSGEAGDDAALAQQHAMSSGTVAITPASMIVPSML
jgi:hypothetical protein